MGGLVARRAYYRGLKMTNLKKKIEEILNELAEKRGRHSKLWMYPKREAIKTAERQLLSLTKEYALSVLPEEKKDTIAEDLRSGKYVRGDDDRRISFNQAIKQAKERINEN